MRRRVKQPWKPRQRSDLGQRDLRRSQMCSTAISNVQCHLGSARLSRSSNYEKVPPFQIHLASIGRPGRPISVERAFAVQRVGLLALAGGTLQEVRSP